MRRRLKSDYVYGRVNHQFIRFNAVQENTVKITIIYWKLRQKFRRGANGNPPPPLAPPLYINNLTSSNDISTCPIIDLTIFNSDLGMSYISLIKRHVLKTGRYTLGDVIYE